MAPAARADCPKTRAATTHNNRFDMGEGSPDAPESKTGMQPLFVVQARSAGFSLSGGSLT